MLSERQTMFDLETRPRAQQGQASARRSTGGTSSKLRDSCQACAASKVKCPKEKPSCSRCDSRGISCQYFLTKRPGRRRESESGGTHASNNKSSISINPNSVIDTDTDTNHSKDRDGDTIKAIPPPVTTRFLSGSTTPPSTRSWGNSYSGTPANPSQPISPRLDDMLMPDSSDIFHVTGDNNMFPDLVDFGCDINDMDFVMSAIDSPFTLPVLDGNGGGGAIAPLRKDIGSLLIPPEGSGPGIAVLSETLLAGDTASTPSAGSSRSSNNQVLWTQTSSVPRTLEPPPCGCLMRALDILKMLSSTQSTPRATSVSGTPESSTASDGDETSRVVLLENKQSIEAVNSMLACSSCAEDSFLFTVSAMVVLKILERYAAAARSQSDRTRAGTAEVALDRVANMMDSTFNNARDTQGTGRRAAQLVLSELHRVQRVVNQLSPKLKEHIEGGGQNLGLGLDLWDHHLVMGNNGGKTPAAASFSADTLGGLEKDVRKSLTSLSAEMINVLRQS